ncbi:DNA-binding transcriptional MerR regulator [Krasilnikovia cinnamomea]|uniref:DNA-binding transcriptional MerR regulator n=1 Tax=Krasilnikovia cinnamomea TaxID=349313 RepID=A0A4Q7ZKN1_9ACTN|nr:MerR family transcriptional regulator [Krasilnikovia cinnamomea]RZU50835.1 DNA-binding transcriptional MerR regulator [Krasilnikovia cinnamomea]
MRPVDLAREAGISAQAVRDYERDGLLPPAERSASGYRRYTEVHARALRTYRALVPAYGYAAAREILRAVHRADLDAALRVIDAGHAGLQRDRETLDTVAAAVERLTGADRPDGERGSGPQGGDPGLGAARTAPGPFTVGEVAGRLGVTAATVRKWERAGIVQPGRDPGTGYRRFTAADIRDADLAHLLRRGGYPLAHIATVVRHVREAGDLAALAAALADWRARVTARGRAMLAAAAQLAGYLDATGQDGRARQPS